MRIPLTILATILAVGGAFAQQNIVYHPNNTPGGRNAFPFGSEGIRYQSIIPRSLFGSPVTTITDIYVFGTNSNLDVVYEDIEIRMGVTQVAPGAITTNWVTNNPKPTTVYRGPLRINFEAGKWAAIGLPKSYLFLALSPQDNLCIEVIVWSAKTMIRGAFSNFCYPGADRKTRRAFLYRWTETKPTVARTGTGACVFGLLLNNGNFVVAGRGCKSSSSTSLVIAGTPYPQPGKDLTVSLSGGQPTTISFLALGGTFAPFEMTPMGAPTCHLWFAPLLSAATVTDASGAANFKATLPVTSVSGTVYAQWYQLDRNANAVGITTSNYATVIFGQ